MFAENDTSVRHEYSTITGNRNMHELEVGDVGRGIQGVKGLCGPGGSIGAGVSVLLTELACGDWVSN